MRRILPFLLIVSGCGNSGSDDGNGGAVGTVSDASQPTTIAATEGPIAGASITLPPGALPVGSTVEMTPTEVPEAFAALADKAHPGSPAISVVATSAEGAAIPEAAVAFTIALPLTDAETKAALHDPAAKAAEMCVFVAVPGGKNLVFRDNAVALDLGLKVLKVDTKLFGVFQVTYCADLVLDGFLEQSATTTPGPQQPATGSGTLEGDVKEFYAKIAKTYKFKAVDTNASDDTTWVHGTEYEIVVDAAGKLTIPSATTPVVFQYGADASDKFEKYDHEAYTTMTRDGAKVLLQHGFANDVVLITWSKKIGEQNVFWRFDAKGPLGTEGPMGLNGASQAVGTHAAKVGSIVGDGATDFTKDQAVSFTIGASAKVTGAFGEFLYKENETSFVQVSSGGGVVGRTITWYKPSKTALPREEFVLDTQEGKPFIRGYYTKYDMQGAFKRYFVAP